jgi:uncharacterized protein (TIGR02118 family)
MPTHRDRGRLSLTDQNTSSTRNVNEPVHLRRSTLIGACSFIQRRTGDSVSHFEKHWLDVHGPLAAELFGVKRYVQNHINLETRATNATARDLRVDGISEMWFTTEEDRQTCYNSDHEAVCDQDSLLFIGASARIVSDVEVLRPVQARPDHDKLMIVRLSQSAGPKNLDPDALLALDGLEGAVLHSIVKQGADPTTDRKKLSIPVAGMTTLYFRDLAALERAVESAAAGFSSPQIATFACRERHLVT